MRPLVSLLLALLFSSNAFAAQSNIPPHLLARTICLGETCDLVNRLGERIAPALVPKADSGTLLIDGEDPIADCLDRIDRDRPLDVSRCVQRKLGGMKAGDALKETNHDGYLVVILREERNGGIQGYAVLLTQMGRTVESDLILDAVSPDGMGSYAPRRAPAGCTIVVVAPFLGERATGAGVIGIPPHFEIINIASPAGSARIMGSGLIPPPH